MSAAWDDPRVECGMRLQLAARQARLGSGEKALGWKVGFGAPAAMERLGIRAPLVGFLTDKALLPAGAKVSLAGWTKPAAEPEILVCMGKDLPGGASRDEASAAIAGLAPAIELADVDRAPDDVAEILAGNIYQRHLITGSTDTSRAGCVLDGLLARVIRNGAEVASTANPEALTGNCVNLVRHVADLLGAFGERLRAGQIIITGSIVPPLWVEAGETLAFQLEPVGSLSVQFAA